MGLKNDAGAVLVSYVSYQSISIIGQYRHMFIYRLVSAYCAS